MQVGDKGLAHLQNLTQLRRLALQGTAMSSTSMLVLAAFTHLQALDIGCTTVDSKGTPPPLLPKPVTGLVACVRCI